MRKGKEIPCEICGKLKYFAPWEQRRNKHFYCSKNCSFIGLSKFHSGKNHPNFGRKFPECSKRMKTDNPMFKEVNKKKVSKSLKKLFSTPEHCNHWSGGWQNKYKCIDCGKQVTHGALRCKSCANKDILSSTFGKCTNIYQNFYYNRLPFRSSWEANFAKWLDLSGIKWKYESRTFNLGNTTYTPDFYLPEFDCYIEIKGYWRKDAKQKVNKFKRKFKNIFLLVFEKDKLNTLGVI